MKAKKLEVCNDLMLRFDDEELASLGWKPGDRIFVETNEDGSIKLSRGSTIDLELTEFTKEQLIAFIIGANERNHTFEEEIEYILEKFIEGHEHDNI